MAKTKEKPAPQPTRKRQFSWPHGLADRVLSKIQTWHLAYEKGEPSGPRGRRPTKAITNPLDPEEKVLAPPAAYKHAIAFSINELRWLNETLQEEAGVDGELMPNPSAEVHRAAAAFLKAYETHVAYIKRNPEFTGEKPQEYVLKREEVRAIFSTLRQLKYGRQTFGQQAEAKGDIGSGNW